jgi:hypothetical protein
MGLSIELTAIGQRIACVLTCTLMTVGGMLRPRDVLQDCTLLIDIKSMRRVWDTMGPLILMSH